MAESFKVLYFHCKRQKKFFEAKKENNLFMINKEKEIKRNFFL